MQLIELYNHVFHVVHIACIPQTMRNMIWAVNKRSWRYLLALSTCFHLAFSTKKVKDLFRIHMQSSFIVWR